METEVEREGGRESNNDIFRILPPVLDTQLVEQRLRELPRPRLAANDLLRGERLLFVCLCCCCFLGGRGVGRAGLLLALVCAGLEAGHCSGWG